MAIEMIALYLLLVLLNVCGYHVPVSYTMRRGPLEH